MKQRFSKRTRLVSALLTLAMVFTFLPFSAFAANTEIDFNSPDFKLNFPDEEFRRFLKECCDKNGDGKLDVDIKNMTIPTSYAIKSLEGIRFFEDLEKLDCHGIGLTTLNVGKNFKLKELDCSQNQLKKSVDILSSGLKKLNCSNNKLTYMNLGILYGLNLEEVNCSNNKITNIVMDSVGELVKFDCSNNDLMTLDVSQCFKLEELNCSGNQLMELDVGHQTQLTQLDCSNNKLTELNVKQNGGLISLICNDNQLTTLDLSQNHSLSKLNCAKNRLACVDVTGISGGTITANGNRRPIAVRTDGKFDLATLPGFDVSRATGWNGGTVSGTMLSVNAGANEVSYQYNCGNGVKPTFIFETSLPINEDNFPDPNFRNYIKTYKAGGRDVLTVEEQRKVETIEVEGKNISSLRGIEAFPNLTELKCGNNSIQKLDLRQNPKLKTLKCNKNQLTQLDLSKNPDIDYLNCSENQLEQLDVSHLKDLVMLNCSHNDLEQLDVRNSKFLETLYCSSNRLTELDADVAHKSRLVSVECQNNQLTSLILGQNKLLKKLNCANNQLTQLNLNNMNSLKELKCQNNQLTALDVSSSPNLTTLVLKNNHLTSLNLDNNPNLNFTYTDIYHSDFNNVYTVTLNPDRTFDLNTLPGNFDINRVTGWVNGTVKGNILTVNEGTNVVYYGYQCRSNMLDVSFTLDVTGTGGTVPPVTPPKPPVTPPEPPVTPPSGGGDGGGQPGILAEEHAALPDVGAGDVDLQRGHALLAVQPGGQFPEFRRRCGVHIDNDRRFAPGQPGQLVPAEGLHPVVLQAHGIEHARRGLHNARTGIALARLKRQALDHNAAQSRQIAVGRELYAVTEGARCREHRVFQFEIVTLPFQGDGKIHAVSRWCNQHLFNGIKQPRPIRPARLNFVRRQEKQAFYGGSVLLWHSTGIKSDV